MAPSHEVYRKAFTDKLSDLLLYILNIVNTIKVIIVAFGYLLNNWAVTNRSLNGYCDILD